MYSVTTHSYSKIFNTKINKSSGRQKYLPVPHSVMHNVLRKPVRAYFPHQCYKIRYIWLRYTHLVNSVSTSHDSSPSNSEQSERTLGHSVSSFCKQFTSKYQSTKTVCWKESWCSPVQCSMRPCTMQHATPYNTVRDPVLCSMWPYTMQHATLYSAVCNPVQCSMQPYTMQYATLSNAVCYPVQCSMQPCPMQYATLYNAVCNPIQCSMQPCTMQCATLYNAVCNPVQCNMQPCPMQYATQYNAVCNPVQCNVQPCTMQYVTLYNAVHTLWRRLRQAVTQEMREPKVRGDSWSTDGVLKPRSISGSYSHMSMLWKCS